jgi:type I restriction enzyme M protein
MIDQESWVRMGADVKGDIYEGLLEKIPKTPKAEQVNTSPPSP